MKIAFGPSLVGTVTPNALVKGLPPKHVTLISAAAGRRRKRLYWNIMCPFRQPKTFVVFGVQRWSDFEKKTRRPKKRSYRPCFTGVKKIYFSIFFFLNMRFFGLKGHFWVFSLDLDVASVFKMRHRTVRIRSKRRVFAHRRVYSLSELCNMSYFSAPTDTATGVFVLFSGVFRVFSGPKTPNEIRKHPNDIRKHL